MREVFKPKPVREVSSTGFKIRCLFDLQLKTIADFLRIELPKLRGGGA